MSKEFAQRAFGRLMSVAQLVDAITSIVHSLTSPEGSGERIDRLPTSAAFQSLQDMPSEGLSPQTVDVMLEALCHVLEEDVLSDVTAIREEMHTMRQRLSAARDSERSALLAADALQEERDESRKSHDALKKQVDELTRTKQQLMDEVADLRLDAGGSADSSAKVSELEQQIVQLQRQNDVLRQAHRGRNVGEVQIQEILQENERTIQEQQTLLAVQQQQLELHKNAAQQFEVQVKMLQRKGQEKPIRVKRKFHRMEPAHLRTRRTYALEPLVPSHRKSDDYQRRESLLVRNLKDDLMDAERREEIRAEVVALECENDLLRRDVARLQADLDDVSAGQGKLNAMIAELKAKTMQLAQARTQLSELEGKMAAKELQLNELKTRVEDLYSELEAFRTENEELRAEVTGRISTDERADRDRKQWEEMEKQLRARLEAALETRAKDEKKAAAATVAAVVPPPPPAHAVDKSTYERELETLKLKMRQRTREVQRMCKEEIATRVQNFTNRLMEYEEEIALLEQRNKNMELRLEKLAEGEKDEAERTTVAGLDKLLKPLPSGEFAVTLPGATTSVKVPVQRFFQHQYIIIHVSLPPQKLVIFNRGGNYRIDKASDVNVMQPPALIDLQETD